VRWNLNIRPKTCFWNLQQVCELLENFLTKLPTSFLSICKSKEQLLFGCGRTHILTVSGFGEPVTKNSNVLRTCRVLSKNMIRQPTKFWLRSRRESESTGIDQMPIFLSQFTVRSGVCYSNCRRSINEVSTGYWSLKTEPYYSEQGLQVGINVYQRISLYANILEFLNPLDLIWGDSRCNSIHLAL
jgi:hypothetical protein